MKIEREDCQDLGRALSLEWLETNGRGGFASGTVAGANTRRYHALLLTARRPPSDRFVLVNQVEEWIEVDGRALPLSTNIYRGVVHPEGYRRCTGFTTVPWPTWTYDCDAGAIRRELFCVRGRDLVLLRWSVGGSNSGPLSLRVRPKLSGRDYHATHRENPTLATDAEARDGRVTFRPYVGLPAVHGLHNGVYRHDPEWYRRIQLEEEKLRGLDHEEDWWSPGEFVYRLTAGSSATLVLTTDSIEALDVEALIDGELQRRTKVRRAAGRKEPLTRSLWEASETYLSVRNHGQTVIAGYPWFTDWGRDTFVSLPGLCLVTGRLEEAWQVIESFSRHVSQGMVPNRFPDQGEQPEYNTIDASLWFIHAVDRYLTYSGNRALVREDVWPVVKQIIDGYRHGTRHNIHMDTDGLVAGGMPGAQLTWMDAKVGDWVVTPRNGKPVEVQALWVRALEVGARLAELSGEPDFAASCRSDRVRAVRSFQSKFWYETGGYFYDVIEGPEGNDVSIRPNQIFAMALCDDLATKERAEKAVLLVREQLLTPVGLRTLSPRDLRYRPRYEGGVAERDSAYHQGTVWPFLLGPFVTAWLNVFGRTKGVVSEARSFMDGLQAHLQERGLGHVSEVFDAEPPHQARGCPAQAWSVAEPLRALIEDLSKPAETRRVVVKRIVQGREKQSRSAVPRRRKSFEA